MTYFIFAGDMLVMAFMTAVVVWVSLRSTVSGIEDAAKIPLDDEELEVEELESELRRG